MAKASCFLSKEIKHYLVEEAGELGITTSDHIASILTGYYESRTKESYILTGKLLCELKNRAGNIGYQNNWCEKDGDCVNCSIRDAYKQGILILKER